MNTKPYVIEIDAQAAFAKLGLDLRISPIAAQCVAALQKQLTGCITLALLFAALAEATGATRSRRSGKKPGKPESNPNPEGQHES
jgi:hypothetical protein